MQQIRRRLFRSIYIGLTQAPWRAAFAVLLTLLLLGGLEGIVALIAALVIQ